MARRFLKLALDIYRDPKVRRYLSDDGDKWCWVALLCYAKECPTPGIITDERWELAERLGVDEDRLQRVIASFTTCPRPPLAISEDDALVINRWDEHQVVYESDTKEARRERARAHRERKKADVTTGNESNESNDVTKSVTSVTKKTTSEERRGDEIRTSPLTPQGGDGGRVIYPPDFEAFWAAYPKKVGKCGALKAWQKADRPALSVLLNAIGRAAGSLQWQKDGGQFVPHPTTWLNQRRWEDEPEPASEGSASDETPYMSPDECEAYQARRRQERQDMLVKLYGPAAVKGAVREAKAGYA